MAAAFVAKHSPARSAESHGAFFEFILKHLPESQTRAGVAQARDHPPTESIESASAALGNGSGLTAPDTVPFCLWCAARAFGNFEEAMWRTVAASGDTDTTCAIVGGIIASDESGAPRAEWIAHREPLPAPLE